MLPWQPEKAVARFDIFLEKSRNSDININDVFIFQFKFNTYMILAEQPIFLSINKHKNIYLHILPGIYSSVTMETS